MSKVQPVVYVGEGGISVLQTAIFSLFILYLLEVAHQQFLVCRDILQMG